jgi:hypothetical protein
MYVLAMGADETDPLRRGWALYSGDPAYPPVRVPGTTLVGRVVVDFAAGMRT